MVGEEFCFSKISARICKLPAPLAQMVRACDSHSQGRRFDSYKAHQWLEKADYSAFGRN